MGSAVSTVANGALKFVGDVLGAPFRSIFDASCDGVCSGMWDVSCFMEHLCLVSLARLFIFLVLSFIMLYLMCKVGLKCVMKRAGKAAMAACSCSCHTLHFLCRKLCSTKRVRRGRHRNDVEEGGVWGGSGFGWSSSEEDSSEGSSGHGRHGRGDAGWSKARAGPPAARERKHDRMRRSLGLTKLSFKEKTMTRRRSHGDTEGHLRRVGSGRRIKESAPAPHAGRGEGRAHGHAHGDDV
ncbi:hypothetical protein E2562_003947 [Oryza meyeriana var. granulata]|uniref:Uncharacterized protein n=1 Tax=Oryza meyeriana var. granulata TaxID=110450 RepID=A0A6G1CZ22_9ORYZ|nr:hypothetical protein E2562_003947 [Oryza meyeriana var. granulata]